jgi:ribonucleoside-diphosphate reductase alpha chain
MQKRKLIYINDNIDSIIERILTDKELEGHGLSEENVLKTIDSFQGDEIACSVFLKKYALRNEKDKITEFTLEEAKERWIKEMMLIERGSFPNGRIVGEDYFRELYDFFLPGGRQMYALGNKYVKNATLANCYVTKIEEDSLDGIFDAAKKIAKTFAYGGGVGLCIGVLRPADALVSNSAKYSTGAVSFMSLYSLITNIIGQKARRGALIITIPINHPDIFSFIEIKHNTEEIEHANISIKLTDKFMNAVVNDDDFELEFKTHHETIKNKIKARELWDKIIVSARDSAEPGLLFWDRMVELSPSDSYEELKVHSTNPCAEEVLEPGGTCVLGSLILYRFVVNPNTEKAFFDFDKFKEMVERGVRHLDNIVEINDNKHALEEQKKAGKLGRRVGLGVTGLADMFASLGIKYDSDEAIKFADKLMHMKKVTEYEASVNLAKERGSFELFDPEKHFSRGFASRLPEDLINYSKQYGLRNVALSTIAPNGSLSVVAQCSSGVEPIYALKYSRFVELGKTRKEFKVLHHGVTRFFHDNSSKEELPEYWIESHNVDYNYRIKLQGTLQKHIDASISSTINLPRDASVETVGQIYIGAWKEGLKGVTVYREGSRESVLVTEGFNKDIDNMDSIIRCVRAEGGDKFYIMVSYKDKDIKEPYQVFVLNYKRKNNDAFIKISNALIRMLNDNGVPEERIQKYIERSNNSLVKLTRFLSLSMKTGLLNEAVEILEEHSFAGSLAARLHSILNKSLKIKRSLCKKCGGSNVRMEETCMRCLDCDWSGCN